jgi:rRNA maturation protein Rpf1
VRVLPNAKYVPRGVKTIGDLASLARSLGHDRVMVVNSLAGRPFELRFLDVTRGWRWLDASIKLREVKLQRELGQKIKLVVRMILARGSTMAREFAKSLGELINLPIPSEPPSSGGIALVTDEKGLQLQFRVGSSSEVIGPVLLISSFR